MDKLFVGVDIGGTNVKIGIIDRLGKILFKSSIKVAGLGDCEKVIKATIDEVEKILKDNNFNNVVGIGMGIPGLIDDKKGLVVCSGNLKWQNQNVVDYVKKYTSLPIKIANDANVAALGESKFGIGKDYNDCVMLTLGTGVGSGIILDGKIFSGNASAGAEIGHMVIETFGKSCTCGGRGCLEAYASATALKSQTLEAMLKHPESKMWEIGGVDKISGKTAFSYSLVDETAKNVVENYVEYLAVGIVNIANIFRPEAVILGGGVSYEGERLLNPLNDKLKTRIFAGDLGPKVELLLASLRNDAGFMGAAALFME